jgi:ribosome-associated protein
MQTEALLKIVEDVLEERKAHNMVVLDVRGKTSFTDCRHRNIKSSH